VEFRWTDEWARALVGVGLSNVAIEERSFVAALFWTTTQGKGLAAKNIEAKGT
jgi:hypothetical protein